MNLEVVFSNVKPRWLAV